MVAKRARGGQVAVPRRCDEHGNCLKIGHLFGKKIIQFIYIYRHHQIIDNTKNEKQEGGSGFPILKHARMVFYTPHHDKLCRLNWLVALPGG